MAEIAINLKGQDNLTKTVKGAKESVDDLKKSSTELGKCEKEFDRITNSGKSLKGQLNQLKALMADMNLKGLANTDEFTKIALKAGEIKDAMADASDAVNRFSSDTQNIDAAVQAIQGIAAAGSIATGVMGLLGTENKKVEQAILKVQSAMAILNGVQAIANTLNKDSALMQRIKAIRLAATTAATTADTVATTANTAATGANTAATVANTVAQKAWNMAKAIGKAMFGDFTGLVLLGVGAVTAYAIATSDAADSEKNRNRVLEEAKRKQHERSEAEQKLASSVASSASTQIAAYLSLQQKWRECGNDVKKQQQFMTKYKDEIQKTGFAVNSLSDAENFFVKNTNAVLAAIQARAEAQANYELMVEKLKKGIEKTHEKSINSGAYYKTANDKNLTDEEKKALEKQFGDRWRTSSYMPGAGGGAYKRYGGMTNEAKEFINQRRNQQAVERNQKWQQETMAETMSDVNEYLRGYQKANERAEKIMKDSNLKTALPKGTAKTPKTPKTPKTTTPKTSNKKNDKKDLQAMEGSVEKMETEVKTLQDKLKKGLIPKKNIEATKAKIDKLNEDIAAKKLELELEVKHDSLEAMQKQLTTFQDKLKKGLIPSDKIEETNAKIKQLEKDIESKKIELGLAPKKGSLEDMQHEVQEITKALSTGLINDDLIATAKQRIEELQKQITAKKVQFGFDEEIKRANKEFKDLKLFEDVDTSSFEKAMKEVNKLNGIKVTNQERLDLIQKEMDYNDNLIKKLKELLEIYERLGDSEGITKVKNKIADLNQKQDEAANKAKQIQDKQVKWDLQEKAMQGVADTAQSVGNAVSSIGSAFSSAGSEAVAAMAEMVAATLNGVAQVIPQIMSLIAAKQGEAMAVGTASAAAQKFPANLAAIAAVTATIISTFASIFAAAQKFADGGIVGGGSTHGDRILARLNSGEMVLNKRHQKNLFNILDNGGIRGNSTQVDFHIKGTELVGTLRNYKNIKSKVGGKTL